MRTVGCGFTTTETGCSDWSSSFRAASIQCNDSVAAWIDWATVFLSSSRTWRRCFPDLGFRIRSRSFASGTPIFVLRLEVQVMRDASEVFGSFQPAFDERLIDDHFGCDIGDFAPLPNLHLLSHRLEVPPHAVDANRDAIHHRERLRVFCRYRGERC
jgi:hypothetical protein